jgi:putative toxin-antitoxin system antitoxin component (TIGR02293 family)
MSTLILDIEKELNKALRALLRELPTRPELNFEKSITFRQLLQNKMLLINVIDYGIPYSIFELIVSMAPFSSDDWAEYLDLSTKSLLRYKADSRDFKSSHSEKILELAEVTQAGREVFGDAETFRQWLETPCFALGGYKPFDLLKNSYGKELVIAELHRIAHGVLA